MKRIKIGIALITMFGLLLGTASVASAKTVSRVNHTKVSQSTTKSTHHQAKTQASKKSVHKSAKSLVKR
ncbi:hypothetical protein [Desulfosporosinus metallidurans]|uniref:hypothetical protein n=1 Tax=Desulfosporosinus metallidurans TaxID=1888891 RepID=UPI00094C72AD|nr:hypothetical protein [Desulfosporosinus metallidurans]